MPHQRLIELLREADPAMLEPFIKKKIAMENQLLQVHTALGNKHECLKIEHRIADAKIFSLILSGDLTL